MRAMRIKNVRQQRRVQRVRKRLLGTPDCPRMAVSRSLANLYVQLIDDIGGKTLCAISTQSKDFKAQAPYGGNVKAATALGHLIGEKAKGLGISAVCFDRRGRRYHGRIKAVAEGARKAGLKF